jgi:hypothetical protein
MKKVTITMLFLLTATLSFAQANLKEGSHAITESADNAYLYAEWLPATVTLKDNTTAKVKARYNVAKQEMEISQGGKQYAVNPNLVEKVVITNVAFVPSGNNFEFYQLIEDNPQFKFLKSFKNIKGKLITKLYKNKKMIPLKKEGIKKNPFVLDEKELTDTKSIKFISKKDENQTIINGRYQGKRGVQSSEKGGLIKSITTFDNREKKIIGSPYLNEKYRLGNIYLKNENKKIVAPIRFNLLKNEFTILFNDKTITLDPLQIKKVILNNKAFIPYTDLNLNVEFYQHLGKINNNEILKHYTCKIIDKPYIPGKTIGDPEQKISITSRYFISNNQTGAIHPLKKNKKTLLALFGEKKKQIEQYVKLNHINIKDSENLSKLIKYYHTL